MDARAELTGLSNCFCNLSIFLVVKTFPSLSRAVGKSGSYCLYTSVCVMNVFFGLCFLPETKGKHLEGKWSMSSNTLFTYIKTLGGSKISSGHGTFAKLSKDINKEFEKVEEDPIEEKGFMTDRENCSDNKT